MERITLASLVKLAKHIASDFKTFRPGMTIQYDLNPTDHELLQREVYVHINKTDEGYQSKKHFECEVMDVIYKFRIV